MPLLQEERTFPEGLPIQDPRQGSNGGCQWPALQEGTSGDVRSTTAAAGRMGN